MADTLSLVAGTPTQSSCGKCRYGYEKSTIGDVKHSYPIATKQDNMSRRSADVQHLAHYFHAGSIDVDEGTSGGCIRVSS